MANQWFRMYSEFANDPKVQRLSEIDQRRYVMLLCLRCSNDDVTLHDEDVAFQLRISEADWAATKATLIERKLILDGNNPTAWDKRQFASDSSTARVAKHREGKKQACNVTSNGDATKGNALDTDTDTDTDAEQKQIQSNPESLSPPSASTKQNGTRLPENWVLPKAWGEWALNERPDLQADDVRRIADAFKDHWLANANQAKSKKSDWQAAWRNWVRNQKSAATKFPQKASVVNQTMENAARAKAMIFGGEENATV